MAWRCTGDKPLSEQMMAQVNDAYIYMSLSLNELKEHQIWINQDSKMTHSGDDENQDDCIFIFPKTIIQHNKG